SCLREDRRRSTQDNTRDWDLKPSPRLHLHLTLHISFKQFLTTETRRSLRVTEQPRRNQTISPRRHAKTRRIAKDFFASSRLRGERDACISVNSVVVRKNVSPASSRQRSC